MKPFYTAALLLLTLACTKKNSQAGADSSALSSSPTPASYAPRLGVVVRTGSRTCLAIHNSGLAPDTPVTLVSTALPQSFSSATIGAPSKDPCPISQNVDSTVSNYELKGANDQIPKLAPLIAVLGSSATFTTANNNVQADLDQNGKTESFRSCSGNDGIYLTVWSGTPLTGGILWNAHYYEPNNPGMGPACTSAETTPVTAS